MAQRHHAVHPPTVVKPNGAVNPKPQSYTPPEHAALPNPNPSLGPVGNNLDMRAPRPPRPDAGVLRGAADVSNPDSPEYDPEDPEYDESLDDSRSAPMPDITIS